MQQPEKNMPQTTEPQPIAEELQDGACSALEYQLRNVFLSLGQLEPAVRDWDQLEIGFTTAQTGGDNLWEIQVRPQTWQLISPFFTAYGLRESRDFYLLNLPEGVTQLRLITTRVSSAIEDMLEVAQAVRREIAAELGIVTSELTYTKEDDLPEFFAATLTNEQQESVVTQWIAAAGSWEAAHRKWLILVESDLVNGRVIEVTSYFAALFNSVAQANGLVPEQDFRLESQAHQYILNPFDAELVMLVFIEMQDTLAPIWEKLQNMSIIAQQETGISPAMARAEKLITQAIDASIQMYGVDNNAYFLGYMNFMKACLDCDMTQELPFFIPITPTYVPILRSYLLASGLTSSDFTFIEDVVDQSTRLLITNNTTVPAALAEFFSAFSRIRHAKVEQFREIKAGARELYIQRLMQQQSEQSLAVPTEPVEQLLPEPSGELPAGVDSTVRKIVRALCKANKPVTISLNRSDKNAQWLVAQAELPAAERHPHTQAVIELLNIRWEGQRPTQGILFSLRKNVSKDELRAAAGVESTVPVVQPRAVRQERVTMPVRMLIDQDIETLQTRHPLIEQLLSELSQNYNRLYLTTLEEEYEKLTRVLICLDNRVKVTRLTSVDTELFTKYWQLEVIERRTAVNLSILSDLQTDTRAALQILCTAVQEIIENPSELDVDESLSLEEEY